MSKKMRTIRLAFTAGVVCLQLFLLPASQVLHVACDHSHHADGSDSHSHAAHDHSSHAHCSHHHHKHDATDPKGDNSDQGTQFPHDSGDCAICQIILAAQIDELHDVQVPISDLILGWTGQYPAEVPPAPLAVPPGRGPPA